MEQENISQAETTSVLFSSSLKFLLQPLFKEEPVKTKESKEDLIKTNNKCCKKFNLKRAKENKTFPTMYWLQKCMRHQFMKDSELFQNTAIISL